MERRRRLSRQFVETVNGLLPRIFVVSRLSLCIVFCSIILVDHAGSIMSFPDDSGVYSLFPDEDLKTGRKRFRFEDEQRGQYREGREYSHLVRSYPMLPHDRLHRPVDYSGGGGSRQYDEYRDRDRDRERHGRVYFDDGFRSSRFDYHRLTPRPRPVERPVSPIIFETSRRPPFRHHHFRPEQYNSHPPPVVGQSKLPPGAGRISGEDDVPTRIHVFDPESNSFGNPRNAGGSGPPSPSSSSAERSKGPPSNFVETGPPGPESFLNHEEFLEYQKKIAFSRFQEQDGTSAGGSSSAGGNNSGKRVLFESKEPFEIDGLSPPDKSAEGSGSSSGRVPSSPSPSSSSSGGSGGRHGSFKPIHGQRDHSPRYLTDQRPKGRGSSPTTSTNHQLHSSQQDPSTSEDTGGGEVESEQVNNEKGEVVESENGKSEVTQLPPTHHHHHIAKSGRVQSSSNGGSGGSGGSKKFTPSISHDEASVGRGTGFKLPTSAASYSAGDENNEPPNLHGFVPVVPFHLIGAEPPRAISLERQREQQQQRIVPLTQRTTTSTRRPSSPPPPPTTTRRSIPVTVRVSKVPEQFSGFRPATGTTTESRVSSSSSIGTDPNLSSSGGGEHSFSGPPSPILHLTAGERINSETHSKVAITKGQELKRLQKQKQLGPVLTPRTNSNPGLFPELVKEDERDLVSAEPVNHGTGTIVTHNHFFDTDPIANTTTTTTTTAGPNDTVQKTEFHVDTTQTSEASSNQTIDHSSALHEHKLVAGESSDDTENNELFDTRTVHTANGIRQGEFHLEGYMLHNTNSNSGVVDSGGRSSGSGAVVDYRSSSNAQDNETPLVVGSHPHLHGPPHPYDYPEFEPTKAAEEEDNALSPELPGTIDLEPELTPYQQRMSSGDTAKNGVEDDQPQTGLYSSRSNRPKEENDPGPVKVDELAFDEEPDMTPPPDTERRARFTQDSGGGTVTPTSPYYKNEIGGVDDVAVNDEENESFPYYPYYSHYGNKINVSVEEPRSSGGSRSSLGKSEVDSLSGDGTEEEPDDNLNRLSGGYRHSGQFSDTSSIDIPLELTLNFKGDEPVDDNEGPLGNAIGSSSGDVEDYPRNTNSYSDTTPLFLESSETLQNKTYYLDGNQNLSDSVAAPFKSLNFIKVTRIKSPSGPGSKETSEKTSATIMARRTSKPAVIVSTTAAGARPRIVGSVVEAGPAWPGLVSNFIRSNNNGVGANRSFTATATVRPRGNIGTNPTHPTEIIARQIQHSPSPTQFKLTQVSRSPSPVGPIPRNPHSASNNISINSNFAKATAHVSNAKLIKPVVIAPSGIANGYNSNGHDNYRGNSTAMSTASNSASNNSSRRVLSSEEADDLSSSLSHIRSNSSTGVVSMVHAHISHCPKLHSPTEVICDVHIREGHGVPSPQLTVGWRRKFYNSTQPDVLLALNRAPASGENGHFEPHHSIMEVQPGEGERLEEFHDKFNVTLAPGISPMLRSVLLIRSVTAPDCGTYQCEVNDGINVLQSETLLFLCH